MLKRQQDLRCTEINLQMWIHHTQHTHTHTAQLHTHSHRNTYAKWALERATWTANEMAIHLLPLQYLWQANNYAASVWVYVLYLCVCVCVSIVCLCVCVYLHNVTQLHLKAHKTSAAFQLENKPQIKYQATSKQFNPRFTFPFPSLSLAGGNLKKKCRN